MDELQADDSSNDIDLINQDAVIESTETIESGPELATGEDASPDKINQDAVQKRINKATAAKHESDRAMKAAQKERDDLKAQLAAIESNKPAPTVSELPDRFEMTDEEFSAALKQRDEQLRNVASYEAKKQANEQALNTANEQAAKAKETVYRKAGEDYAKRSDALGISRENQTKAADVVVGYGISDDVKLHIVNDVNGPLIIQHLASNPADLDDLSQMNNMEAAVYISNTLSKSALSLKTKSSNAPDPLTPLKGNGVDPEAGRYKNIGGAKFS